jgi:hypothetical protein
MKEKIIKILQEKNKNITPETEVALEQFLEMSNGEVEEINSILKWLEKKRKECNIKTEETGIK